MMLVIGGIASGKRTYLRSLGFSDSDMSAALEDSCPVLLDAQDLVRDGAGRDVDVEAIVAEAARCKKAVTITEVGMGIVPIDGGERAWRERAGVLSQELARASDVVVRMVCGIPTALKV